MNPQIRVENAEFFRALEKLAQETGKSLSQVLRFNAIRVAYNLMIVTQPWIGKENIREHKGQHIYHGRSDHNLGKAAVMRDVGQVYSSHQQITNQIKMLNEDMAKGFSKAIRNGDTKEAQRIMKASGIRDRNADVVSSIDTSEHRKLRNNKGRVSRHRAVHVGPKREIDTYAKEVANRVGFAKAGFAAAAGRLGKMSHVPAWVKRHSAPGAAKDNSRSKGSPYVEFSNLVRYASKILPTAQVAKAIRIQRQKMLAQIDHVIAANATKAGFQAKATTPSPEPIDV